MKRTIKFKRLTTSSLLKFLCIGILPPVIFFTALIGLLTLVGIGDITLDGKQLQGWRGLIAVLFVGAKVAFFGIIFGLITLTPGFLLFAKMGFIELEYLSEEELDQKIDSSNTAEQGAAANPYPLRG